MPHLIQADPSDLPNEGVLTSNSASQAMFRATLSDLPLDASMRRRGALDGSPSTLTGNGL